VQFVGIEWFAGSSGGLAFGGGQQNKHQKSLPARHRLPPERHCRPPAAGGLKQTAWCTVS
jgi:hypothetical protein